MLKLIANDERRNHGQLLRGWLKGCDNGFAAVAFLKRSGLKQIEADLREFLGRGGYLRFVVGTDFHLTEPEALRVVFQLGCDFPRFEWRMVAQSLVSTFHPKYYRFQGDGRIWVLTGSANLTAGGLEGNVEVSTIAEDESDGILATEAKRIEAALWTHDRCREPSEAGIGAYAVGFKLNRQHMREAADRLKKDLETLPDMEGKALENELRDYRSDDGEREDLMRRRSNYERAREMIREQLLGSPELASANFESVYEALVGKSGGLKLWHSGSVYRGKVEVMKHKDAVLAMIHEIADNLNRTPEAMYEVGLRWMDQISGLGPNIFTEFCNTLRPDLYATLNSNPVTSLFELGIYDFPSPSAFKPTDYGSFCRRIHQLATRCGFHDFGETDHFLNFVYWRHKDKRNEGTSPDES